MSLNRLIEDTYKPWLNVRVNDLVVDGTLIIEDSGVTAGTYGSSSQTPVVTVNSSGLITGITQTPTFKPTVWALGLSTPLVIASTVTQPTGVTLTFDIQELNTPSWYNPATGIFTIPAGNQGAYRFDLFVSFNAQTPPFTSMVEVASLFFLQQLTGTPTTIKEYEYTYAQLTPDQRESVVLSAIVPVPNITQTYRWLLSQISSDSSRNLLLDGDPTGRYCQLSITRLT